MKSTKKGGFFDRFAKRTAYATGRPLTFGLAVFVILAWCVSGPYFHFSDTWQLAINTSTTIITFLMVFLIQNTQNRDSQAAQLKLDELIRANKAAHDVMLDVEELSDVDMQRIRRAYSRLASESRKALKKGGTDTGSPAIPSEVFEKKG